MNQNKLKTNKSIVSSNNIQIHAVIKNWFKTLKSIIIKNLIEFIWKADTFDVYATDLNQTVLDENKVMKQNVKNYS